MLHHERDGWWLTIDGKRRKLDHEPEQDGDWLICASNGMPIRVHCAMAVTNNWAWTWIVGGLVILALTGYLLVCALTRR